MNIDGETFTLRCVECSATLSDFGYKSALLSDHYINVYSTNSFSDKIACVYEPYISKKCECAVRDIACAACGLVVGYHVEQPCRKCLGEENNGHMWMFAEGKIGVVCRKSRGGIRPLSFARMGTMCNISDPER